MSDLRLSIIIPFYNVEQYIAECLDSVFDQDIPLDEYEVICVDDCSPDNSLKIVEDYAKKYPNLVLVRNQQNRKLGGARNAGIYVAKGRYVWFVDSDDFTERNSVGNLLSIAESQDLDVLHFNYSEYPNANLPPRRPKETAVTNGTEAFFDSGFIWYHDLVTAWRKLYKLQFLLENNIRFAEHIMFEDNDYAIEVFANAHRVKHIDVVAYHYRNNPDSITHVNHTSAHVFYWLDLCHRLCRLKETLMQKQKDLRFKSVIDAFIRFHISNVLKVYEKMDATKQKETRQIIRREMNAELKPYTSKQTYYKMKFGIL